MPPATSQQILLLSTVLLFLSFVPVARAAQATTIDGLDAPSLGESPLGTLWEQSCDDSAAVAPKPSSPCSTPIDLTVPASTATAASGLFPIEQWRNPITDATQLLAQNVYGRFWQGVSGGIRLANPPTPGVVLDNAFIFFSVDTFVDGEGNKISLGSSFEPVVNRTAVAWGSNFKVLAASYGVVISIPLANLETRPFPGVEAAFGLGDIYFQPLTLGWRQGQWNFVTTYGFWAPTGHFEPGGRRNTGRGFWTSMFTGVTTYTSTGELPWIASLMARYEIHTQIQGMDLRPGDTFTLEYGVGKTVIPNMDLGIAGYATFQTTTTTGSDFTGDPTRYRYFGLGPEIQYRLPKARLRLRLNTYFDFGVRNASQGFNTIFSVGYRF